MTGKMSEISRKCLHDQNVITGITCKSGKVKKKNSEFLKCGCLDHSLMANDSKVKNFCELDEGT